MKLRTGKVKILGSIISPFHIDNNEIYDRLDYFVFDGWDVIQIVNRKWLIDCGEKDKQLFNDIIDSIKEGDFIRLEDLKAKFYEKYFDSKKYLIKEIKIGNQALKHLIMDGNKNNTGEIKKFSRFGENEEIIIPGSTLKGLFRTILLQKKATGKTQNNQNYIKFAEDLENFDKEIKKDFSNIFFEDVKVKNPEIKIQNLKLYTQGRGAIPVIAETLVGGEFEIIIKYNENNKRIKEFVDNLENYLKDYSTIIIGRQEQILDKFEDLENKIIEKLDNQMNNGKYPVKIGMFKKSLTYKLFWEEELQDIYKKLVELLKNKKRLQDSEFYKIFNELKLNKFGFKDVKSFKNWYNRSLKGKPTKLVGQKLGIGDRSFYIDENGNPLGWISLELKNKND